MTQRRGFRQAGKHFIRNLRKFFHCLRLKEHAALELLPGMNSGKHLVRRLAQGFQLNHRISPPLSIVSSFLRARDRRLEIVPSGRSSIWAISEMPKP